MEAIKENEVTGMVVAVRIKPLEDNEQELSIQSVGDNLLRVSSYDPKTYQFDYVHWSTGTSHDFPHYVSQDMVFESVGQPIVQNSTLGYNCSLFAYGQTGSGKTYTMFGEKHDEGLIPRVCRALMTSPVVEGTIRTFKITYVEIFLEKVRDLLKGSHGPQGKPLKVREHPTDGPFVEGATSAEILTHTECMKLMDLGTKNRMVATTKMNEQSSRSHAIFTITSTVTKKLNESDHKSTDEEDVYTIVSKINLIDLAGSENAISAGSTGDRLKEGAAINKSLLTLGRVIKVLADNSMIKNQQKHIRRSTVGSVLGRGELSALEENSTPSGSRAMNNLIHAERRGSGGFNSPSLKRGNSQNGMEKPETPGTKKPSIIPYRDSVLTYLLKDSLGGNSKTTMIATIRPGARYGEETANTLRYAAQAKKIVNVVVVNENPYVKMIKKLQLEVEELTKQLQTMKPESPQNIPREETTPQLNESDKTSSSSIPPTDIDSSKPITPSSDSVSDSGPPATAAVVVKSRPSVEIPQLTRQFTSPHDDLEQPESILNNGDNEIKSDEGSDSFFDEDEDEDENENENGTFENDSSKVMNNSLQPPHSPVRVRHRSEDKVPHLLNSLQKKLSMVRQTSIEVSETFDRLSSPTKKSQNRPNQFLFQNGNESPEINHQQQGQEEATEPVITPYRPVALFRDIMGEAPSEEVTQDTSSLHEQNNNENNLQLSTPQVQSTSTDNQSSPVVVLYTESNFKSPLPSSTVVKPTSNETALHSSSSTSQDPLPAVSPSPCEVSPTTTPQLKETRMSHTSSNSHESDFSQQPVKEGFLMKRGYINKAFQRRWCVLKGKDIFYYKQYRDKDVRGQINCLNATVVRAENHKDDLPFAFYLHTPRDSNHVKWLLQAASDDEMNSWISAIEHVSLTHAQEGIPSLSPSSPTTSSTPEDTSMTTCVIS